ncbi:hypothetical protein L917_15323 [Phytophthora nicotianae]|uniref:RxLR effector protein n=1 Tax=Phytophthora nicotianae TaxID=4792 RepID=W2KKY0_PHYNI|nr:hypothetical protein L917_15323 [Phytophthora nicotianae]
MRFLATVLLGFAVFLLFLDCSRAATNANPLNLSHRRDTQRHKGVERLLRPVTSDNESRMVPLPGVDAAIKAALPKLTRTDKLQLRFWLLWNERIDKVLNKLNLGANVESVLTNPKLRFLHYYITKLNQKSSNAAVTMADTLASKYGLVPVAKMLEKGKTSTGSSDVTKALAKELQLEQFTGWANMKLSPVDVYMKLELKSQYSTSLGGPVFEAWAGYVRKLNRGNDDTATSSMLEALKEVYGDRGAALLLFESKELFDPKKTVGKMRLTQYKTWMENGVDEKNFLKKALGSESLKPTVADEKILNEYLLFVKPYHKAHGARL